MRSVFVLVACMIGFGSAGCASVKFFKVTKEDVKCDEFGFEYYPPKPYLLVQNTEKGRDVKLISLPDLTRKRLIKHQAGWGTNEFGFKTDNGMIAEFNQKYDSKGPEALTAAAGMVTALTPAAPAAAGPSALDQVLGAIISKLGAAQTAATDPSVKNLIAKAPTVMEPIPIPPIKAAIEELDRIIGRLTGLGSPEVATLKKRLEDIKALLLPFQEIKLDTFAGGLSDPGTYAVVFAKQVIPFVLKQFEEAQKAARKAVTMLKEERAILSDWVANVEIVPPMPAFGEIKHSISGLDKIISELTNFAGPTLPALELYEVLESDCGLTFRRVRTF